MSVVPSLPRGVRPPGGLRSRVDRVAAAGALLLGLFALGACASVPGAGEAEAYRGSWAYAQACGLQHSARLDIDIAGDGSIRGEWNDGTRVSGESGRLAGRVRGDRLDLRLCPPSGDCAPPSASAADAHLRREGGTLGWYRRYGAGSADAPSARDTRYLTLHPVVGDADPPLDTACKDDAETP